MAQQPEFSAGDLVEFDAPASHGRRVAGIDRIVSVAWQTQGERVIYRYELESGVTVQDNHIRRLVTPHP